MKSMANGDPDRNRYHQPTVALRTVGCKLNRSESETMARQLLGAGFRMVPPDETADVCILNTCTVTHIADRKCRQYLRTFRKRNPQALVIAVGCYVNRDATTLAAIKGIDLLLTNEKKDHIVEIIIDHLKPQIPFPRTGEDSAQSGILGTRSMIRIQSGCNRRCAYCIVPRVRGPETSTPPERIISKLRKCSAEGVQEIVLTGTRIGAYRYEGGLEGLLRRLLDETAIPRIRISSLEPDELSPSLLDLWRTNERLCRHLHMALQSGSDSVLTCMQRGYTGESYRKAVRAVREAIPDIAITTDVIVGFPGETAEAFEESYRFCEEMAFAGIHVFPYSDRSGTPATALEGKVPEGIKNERTRRMLDLSQRSAQAFRRRFRGKVLPVLWEEQKNGVWTGYTSNYIRVFARSDRPLANRLVLARLGEEYHQGLWGEVSDEEMAERSGECEHRWLKVST